MDAVVYVVIGYVHVQQYLWLLESKWNSRLKKRVVLFCYMISLSKTEYVGVVVLCYWPPTTPYTHAVRPGDEINNLEHNHTLEMQTYFAD